MLLGCAGQPSAPDKPGAQILPAISGTVDAQILASIKGGHEIVPPQQSASVNDALLPPLRAEMPRSGLVPFEQRFDLVVNSAPAQQVFMSIVSGTRYSLVVHPAVAGIISVNLKDVTVPEALEAIREVYGYEYRIDGSRVYVQAAGMQTRMFQVNYLVGIRSGTSGMSVKSGTAATVQSSSAIVPTDPASGNPGAITQTAASTVFMATQTDFWAELAATLRALVGTADGRNVVVNSQSGVVVVRAMPDELRLVDSYLRALRLSVERQVILEAKIIEVTLSEATQSGVNWSRVSGSRSNIGPGPAVAGPGLTAASGAIGPATQGLALQATDFAPLLQFLESQGAIQVLSSPRVATVNNQKAVLKVGLDQNYVSQVQATPVVNPATGAQTGVSFTPTLAPYFSGVSLDITPQIDGEGNILLHIHPLVSRVDSGNLAFNFGGALGQQNLAIAKATINETDTIVRVQDGNIVALGGLMQISLEADRSGTPGSRDGAGASVLSGNRTTSMVKKELVILVRPTVIQGDRNWQRNLQEARERLQSYGAGDTSGTRSR